MNAKPGMQPGPWLRDSVRLLWTLASLNLRKSWYSSRGGRNPCQNLCHAGLHRGIACDEVLSWHHPERLSFACPLLRKGPDDSWLCTAPGPHPRTYWGRAGAVFLSLFAVTYLAGASSAYTAWKLQGFNLAFTDVLLPSRWPQLPSIKSRHLLANAQAALAARDVRSAQVHLATATALNPADYTASRLLAELTKVTHPSESDDRFLFLLRNHPNHAEATARAWLPALLSRGNFASVESLAAARLLVAEPSNHDFWLRAFFFAHPRTRAEEPLLRLLESPLLAPPLRAALTFLRDMERAPSGIRRQHLLAGASTASLPPACLVYQVRELNEGGWPDDALDHLRRLEGELNDYDFWQLKLQSLSLQSDQTPMRAAAAVLLALADDPFALELLCAHLLHQPDPTLSATLFARMESASHPAITANCPLQLAVYCLAVSLHDRRQQDLATVRIERASGAAFRVARAISTREETNAGHTNLAAWLPLIDPLPLPVIYAILSINPEKSGP